MRLLSRMAWTLGNNWNCCSLIRDGHVFSLWHDARAHKEFNKVPYGVGNFSCHCALAQQVSKSPLSQNTSGNQEQLRKTARSKSVSFDCSRWGYIAFLRKCERSFFLVMCSEKRAMQCREITSNAFFFFLVDRGHLQVTSLVGDTHTITISCKQDSESLYVSFSTHACHLTLDDKKTPIWPLAHDGGMWIMEPHHLQSAQGVEYAGFARPLEILKYPWF